MDDILPCPFCGESDLLQIETLSKTKEERLCKVICYRCDSNGPIGLTREEARLLWNHRTP